MKNRKSIFLLITLVVCVIVIGSFFFSTESNSLAATNDSFKTDKAIKSDDIPDYVAYELFLRTVADSNARGLVKRAGFNDDEVEKIMSEAYSLNSVLESADAKAREITENRSNLSKSQIQVELSKLQVKKDEVVVRAISRSLPSNLQDERANKLRDFINSDVKRNTQISFDKTLNKSLPKTRTESKVFLYSAVWQEGMTVFGAGALSKQFAGQTSYRIITTVISPDGRSNTTESDWSHDTVTNSTGLSIGVEDGIYSVQTNFEKQQGYYDEYDNFYGSGSSSVESSTNSFVVAPTVSITAVDPSGDVELRRGENKTFKVAVQATGGVVSGTQVFLEFNEVSNFSGVDYSVDDRTKSFSFAGSGTTVNTPFVVSVNGASPTGNVINKGRIDRAVAPDGTEVTVGTRESANMSFTVKLSPTACNNECIEINPLCPCYDQYGSLNKSAPSCNSSPRFVKAGYSPKTKSALVPFCSCVSPVVIDVAGDGFNLTDAPNGVPFDFNGDGIKAGKLAWTSADSDDAWLVLDRNRNNSIDNGAELFGNATPQPAAPAGEEKQGFLALAEYDKPENGGNSDGKITRSDSVFKKLRLWQDRNHNGISEAEELLSLPALDVVVLFLDYRESRRADEHGNQFRYRAKVGDARGARVGRWAWDVFLTTAP